jgi:hypothetical protein
MLPAIQQEALEAPEATRAQGNAARPLRARGGHRRGRARARRRPQGDPHPGLMRPPAPPPRVPDQALDPLQPPGWRPRGPQAAGARGGRADRDRTRLLRHRGGRPRGGGETRPALRSAGLPKSRAGSRGGSPRCAQPDRDRRSQGPCALQESLDTQVLHPARLQLRYVRLARAQEPRELPLGQTPLLAQRHDLLFI